ncbi:46 kDa FK506-binding nuclear protein-like protein [Leptotrombidium deliense]|uniref:peptidylprolyl isomerase n=1 Tax=Leptotrombidium deliense TaxID=299467 RepID=A0A443SEY6_9ACAR|nr:46 kDa FK506-binding nuclear protein-like protein [Leptotrombidium deliense]
MFWGKVLESGKRYSHKVDKTYHLTMAALEPDTKKKGKTVSVMLEHEDEQFILCNLNYDNVLHQSLDLVFVEGEEVAFSVNGEGKVHLTGYLLPDDEFDEFGDEMGEESDDLSDNELIQKKINAVSDKRKLDKVNEKPAVESNKKAKVESNKPAENKNAVPTPNKTNLKKDSSEKGLKKLSGGVTVKDVIVGNGPETKNGKFLHVHYVGKLAQNNKEFDRSGNKPFAFRFGGGEVIKGWEVGLAGMKVGGKRIITVPPSMGYGNRKVGAIPANSTLNFEVELKAIN